MVLEIGGGLFGQSDVRETTGITANPTIGDFTSAQHNHSNAAGGGDITDSTIDHALITNTHNLTTDIDHNSLTNNHNLTTDINHDALTNFTATEHFTEASIDHTNLLNIGTKTHAQIDDHLNGDDQTEIYKYLNLPNDSSYGEIYTVPAGKTFYVSTMILVNMNAAGGNMSIATGAAASESLFLIFYLDTDNADVGTKIITMPTPLKFPTGTRISGKIVGDQSTGHATLIGYEK